MLALGEGRKGRIGERVLVRKLVGMGESDRVQVRDGVASAADYYGTLPSLRWLQYRPLYRCVHNPTNLNEMTPLNAS
jgi:hypothetical protein